MVDSKKDKDTNNVDIYLFKQGTNYRSYNFLGTHRISDKETVFRVWAPNAEAVYLTGDFEGWNDGQPMECVQGIWQTTVPNDKLFTYSKYCYIIERFGQRRYKSDPYAVFSEVSTPAASMCFDIDGFGWTDSGYLENRKKLSSQIKSHKGISAPVNIYELHLGSWKRNHDGSYMGYRQLADELSAYVKKMGYTHVELLPVAEHPYDGSWGYQVCGYYAPSSRFGNPHDFMYFINKMHSVGVGVIMDWVPAHFPKDAHGLYEFDGAPLYEYQGADRMEYKTWGTRAFDVGRTEVQSFLISNAMYWCDKYHIDGLRVDAVASMLYLDYDRNPGEWFPNPDGSNISREAVAFFKKFNSVIHSEYPDVMTIAEESTDYVGITHADGLGFTMKWNMGWMHDTLDYIETDSIYRKHQHNKMTFSMMYAFKENYVLPISHDEVVHGKKSLIDKMFGDYEQKFACMRTYLCYMMAHPGKKLSFMGNEYGQFREWDYGNSLEWFMLDYEKHSKLQFFNASLNHYYLSHSAFWEIDDSWNGFEWINADDCDNNVYVFRRINSKGDTVTVALNFSPVRRDWYGIAVDTPGWYTVALNSDDTAFGGSGTPIDTVVSSYKLPDGKEQISVTLPPLSGLYIEKKNTVKKK